MVELVLAGPGKNALGTPVMERALQDLYAARGEPLLVRGEGSCFSAGLNLKEIATLDADQMEKFLALLDTLVVGLLEHAGPVVACINGHAIAGGCVIALACDLRVCTSAPTTRVGLNEVALGLTFPPRILKLARARLAPSHATRVLLEAGLYAPQEALRLGLVHTVSDQVEQDARKLLEQLARNSPEAYAATKRELNEPVLSLNPQEIAAFTERVLPRWTSEELKAKMLRALAKN
jgi:enoyl-CoA hydratase